MPREMVRPYDDRLPTVEVGWSREAGGSVQLSLQTPLDEAGGQHHILDQWYSGQATLANIGRDLAYRLGLLTDGPGSGELRDALAAVNAAQDSEAVQLAYQHAGRQVLDAVTGSSAEVGVAWATHLDRYGLNRLVTLARKARNGAFGRDE